MTKAKLYMLVALLLMARGVTMQAQTVDDFWMDIDPPTTGVYSLIEDAEGNITVNGTQYNNVHLQTVDELAYSSRGELGIYHYGTPTYSFDLFRGTAYTYDTPAMNNFNSSLSNFGL